MKRTIQKRIIIILLILIALLVITIYFSPIKIIEENESIASAITLNSDLEKINVDENTVKKLSSLMQDSYYRKYLKNKNYFSYGDALVIHIFTTNEEHFLLELIGGEIWIENVYEGKLYICQDEELYLSIQELFE